MSRFVHFVTSSPDTLVPLLLDLTVKGTILLAVLAVVAFACRRRSAALRHLVWGLGLVGLLILAPLALLVPAWQGPIPVPWAEAHRPPVKAEGTEGVAEPMVPPEVAYGPFVATGAPQLGPQTQLEGTAPPTYAARLVTEKSDPEWRSIVLFVWCVGVVLTGLPLVGGLWGVGRLRKRAVVVTEGTLTDMLTELKTELGVRRPVTLLEGSDLAMPMTWGVLRPVLLLPAGASFWPAQRLRAVLLHELAHVRRLDCLLQVLASLVRALYWFHPLAWLAAARLRAEQEQACDDAVLAAGVDPADYAEHLLSVTSRAEPYAIATPVALAMGKARRLERRLTSILEEGRNRRPVGRWVFGMFAALVFALLLPLASMAFQAAEPAESADVAAGEPGPVLNERNFDLPATAETAEAKQVEEARAALLKHYVTPLAPKSLNEAAIKGMVKSLGDRYSDYLTPDEMTALARQTGGEFAGVGAQLHVKGGRIVVQTPLDDSPALKAGLLPGDILLAIDGKSTEKLNLNEAVKLILGKPGTSVKLKVQHADGKEDELTITRERVRIRSVLGFRRGADQGWQFLLDPEHKIGYLQIQSFSQPTAHEVAAAVAALEKEGMKGLLLDLRFCPGGLLKSATDTADLFLPAGAKIVTVEGRNNDKSSFVATGKANLGDFPLLVLINEQTASGAEILAGALRDNGRANVLGTRSYGKGSVQTILQLGEGEGALKLTTASYFLPSGRNIDRRAGETHWGVDPNDGFWVGVEPGQEEALLHKSQERRVIDRKAKPRPAITPRVLEEEYSDPQLAAALKAMTAKLTSGEYAKVGQGGEKAEQLERKAELQRKREELRREMERLNQQLKELDKENK